MEGFSGQKKYLCWPLLCTVDLASLEKVKIYLSIEVVLMGVCALISAVYNDLGIVEIYNDAISFVIASR